VEILKEHLKKLEKFYIFKEVDKGKEWVSYDKVVKIIIKQVEVLKKYHASFLIIILKYNF